MNSRLHLRLVNARNLLSKNATRGCQFAFLGVVAIILGANFGCAGKSGHLQSSIDRSAAKLSFVSWNLRAMVTEPRESTQSRAFRIASLSNRELYRLMETRPAPDLATISGKWNGINKGVGSAVMGLMQDVKVLEGDSCVSGYNILVKQVSINDLPCRGWQAELDPKTCKPKTMGNFIAVAPTCWGELGHTVKLDYTVAKNPWYDPSRFLIDELVAIDEDILLGRATANIGSMHIPVAYFVLTRAPQCNCLQAEDVGTCRSFETKNYAEPEVSVLVPTPNREIVNREILFDKETPISDASATPVNKTKTDELKSDEPRDKLDTDTSASDKPIVFEATESPLVD